MADNKYDKLERMRNDIQKDRNKVSKLQEQIKQKEAKLKEAEASQIVSDVDAMNMSPEQLGQFLALIQSGQLSSFLNAQENTMNIAKSETGTSIVDNHEIKSREDEADDEI